MAEQRGRDEMPQREGDTPRVDTTRAEPDGPPANVLRDKGVEPVERRREAGREGDGRT